MLTVSHVSKRYGNKTILSDISFQANCGESIAIVGKNGCGKTTLMQILSGATRPDCGEIIFFGKNPLKQRKYFSEYCGYVPQEPPLIEELSVKDNLKLWGIKQSERHEVLLESFQLKELMTMEVRKLSGGMKRRLSIVCALAGWPPILLLDEPTTALDLYYKDSIQQWLKQYREMNGIVVMTSHDEKEILSCDRCLVMRKGFLTELGKEEFTMSKIKEYIMASD